jgi:hypothetical protein
MIVPGGGISLDGTRWIPCRPGFLLPAWVLSRLFRRLFLTALADAHAASRLAFFGEIVHLCRRETFDAYLAPLRRKNWFVFARPPFAGPEAVLAQCRLQGQYRTRQAPDGHPNAARRAAGSTGRNRSGSRHRSSPAMPVLRRPHDYC